MVLLIIYVCLIQTLDYNHTAIPQQYSQPATPQLSLFNSDSSTIQHTYATRPLPPSILILWHGRNVR